MIGNGSKQGPSRSLTTGPIAWPESEREICFTLCDRDLHEVGRPVSGANAREIVQKLDTRPMPESKSFRKLNSIEILVRQLDRV
jgi:hypothetical protein